MRILRRREWSVGVEVGSPLYDIVRGGTGEREDHRDDA